MAKRAWDRPADDGLATFGGGGAQLPAILRKGYGHARGDADVETDVFSNESAG